MEQSEEPMKAPTPPEGKGWGEEELGKPRHNPAHGSPPAKRSFSQRVRIDQAGRVVVPAPIRKALGISDGQVLHISLDDGFIRLQTVEAGLERIRAIARRRGRSSERVVDEFIAERRAESAKE